MTVVDPRQWLTTGFDALAQYLNAEIDGAVLNDLQQPAGMEVYSLIMDYPIASDLPLDAEFTKTIIHLVIDDITNKRLGFGSNVVDDVVVDPADPLVGPAGTVTEREAGWHEINFDIGVWATDQSGGSSSRLRAYQMLYTALGTEQARQRLKAVSEGIEILRYDSGRFITERINEIRMFRIVGAELVVRIFSRIDAPPVAFADKDSVIQSAAVIGDENIVDS